MSASSNLFPNANFTLTNNSRFFCDDFTRAINTSLSERKV